MQKIDIYVKSFNRPYYLERCIRSIYQYVKGDFNIIVLDDGTPDVYLRRIQELFRDVVVHKSPDYEQKSRAIEEHVTDKKAYNINSIPVDFWVSAVRSGSSVFLLLEDDIWLVNDVDLEEVGSLMQARNIAMLKLSWLGNDTLIEGRKEALGQHYQEVVPNFTWLRKSYLLNRYKIRSIYFRSGIPKLIPKKDFEWQMCFYTIYAVASAFFDREYWLYMWSEKQEKVDEQMQLIKAVRWYEKYKPRFAKSREEATKTSFLTSTNNRYEDVHFDMIKFNSFINDAWLAGKVDCMENFPRDFSLEYLQSFLKEHNKEDVSAAGLAKWSAKFQQQYLNIGCKVD